LEKKSLLEVFFFIFIFSYSSASLAWRSQNKKKKKKKEKSMAKIRKKRHHINWLGFSLMSYLIAFYCEL
jgi:uncharacterized membrane protein